MTELRLWRIQNRISAEKIARRLKIGCSTFRAIEAGRLSPSEAQWKKFRDFFGNDAERLLNVVRGTVKR